MGIKITATQTFGLCNCSEDDTISLQNEHLFGDLNRPGAPTLGRFFFYSKILSVSSEYKEELSGSSSSDD